MRSIEERSEALELVAGGMPTAAVARATGVPRSTIRYWLGSADRREHPATRSCRTCGAPAHDFGALPPVEYAYLLGQYLGDGCISPGRRGVYALRIACCAAYPGIVAETRAAVEAIAPRRKSGTFAPPGVIEVKSYSKSWPCLFPQHGPGRKHERPIVLADWQREIVAGAPRAFVRGLIHSDGWRGTNRVTIKGRTYEYPRYNFTNASADILGLFCEALDQLGISWRRMTERDISIARKDAVAALDAFVGPKC